MILCARFVFGKLMDRLLYLVVRAVLALLQAFPLLWIAQLGRAAGALAYWLDRRHRRVALDNITACFQTEKTPAEIRALVRENFRRIGENFACAAKTATMDASAIRRCVEFSGGQHLISILDQGDAPNRLFAIGHFGNFELYARANIFIPRYQFATTYRALRQPAFNRLLQELRRRSGCWFFERRTEAAELRAAMKQKGLMLGFLVDQHAGDRGLPAPFFGRECSTSPAPALFALRYDCPLHTAFCYRIGLGRWRLEWGPEIPIRENGRARTAQAITADINRVFEAAIRRDPANWFWVHRRWKPVRRRLNPKPLE